MAGEMVTYRSLLRGAREVLAEASVPEAEADARALLFEAFSMDMASWLLCADGAVTDKEAERRFRAWIARRAQREPLQYITGTAWFAGERFIVTPDVLIPRQDTEVLTAEVMKQYPAGSGRGKLLDLCTGSGCILLTLMRHRCFAEGTGTDISEAALALAGRNAEALDTAVRLCRGDLFGAVPGERFDVITANPPYVTEDEYRELDPEVKREPKGALTAEDDGLAFYERIAAEAQDRLNPGGRIFLEIGCRQRAAVSAMLAAAGLSGIGCVKDPAGLDRVVFARKEEG